MINKDLIMYLERKMRGSQDSRRTRSSGRRERDNRRSHEDDYEDGRRYPMDRLDYNRRARAPRGEEYDEDYDDPRDYADGEDYHQYKHLKLTKADFTKWEKMLHNADGSHGPHYTYEQALMAAEKLGIRFDAYTEREFYICLNMMYADYSPVITKHVPPEKVLQVLAEMVKAFFDDPDGPEPSEKLALYFHCVACANE